MVPQKEAIYVREAGLDSSLGPRNPLASKPLLPEATGRGEIRGLWRECEGDKSVLDRVRVEALLGVLHRLADAVDTSASAGLGGLALRIRAGWDVLDMVRCSDPTGLLTVAVAGGGGGTGGGSALWG